MQECDQPTFKVRQVQVGWDGYRSITLTQDLLFNLDAARPDDQDVQARPLRSRPSFHV